MTFLSFEQSPLIFQKKNYLVKSAVQVTVRNRSSNSSSVKIQELFLFPLLFSWNCSFSSYFFSSFTSTPDAKLASQLSTNFVYSDINFTLFYCSIELFDSFLL